MAEYAQIKYDDIIVSFTPDLDGGGNEFGQAYIPFVRRHLGKVESVFEWCAGPGFIGFSLLASGLCGSLDLGDVNEAAQKAAERTILQNGLQTRARFFLSDCFERVPIDLKWDLLVGNPPHVNAVGPSSQYQHERSPLIWSDPGWSIHRRFYRQARSRLKPGGSLLIQENYRNSSPDDFLQLIKDADLEVKDVYSCGTGFESYYFLWSGIPG